ncbi:ABC transporter substrate-binding protein [Pseudodesulfovibrio sp. S3]|nr:ABC transporter substrate-binding protein [Pseudodesulfovibrio sp. S3]
MIRVNWVLILLCCFLSFQAQADTGAEDTISEVVSAGPFWDTFTNRDGTGLYHEVLDAVFALYNVRVRHDYVPSDRADELVRLGWADMMICDDKAMEPLRLARYPLYVNDYYVFFDKARIGPWQGPESLRGMEVVAQKGFYHTWDFPVPVRIREMSSGLKCLEMVLLGRSDFYVDDMSFIQQSIAEGPRFDRKLFDFRKAGNRSYHPMFSSSPRSSVVMKMYDDGMRTLHENGKLRPIYEKRGHSYPNFDDY